MEITIKETVEKKVELQLPAYFKSDAYYYKIISENKCLVVCYAKDMESIQVYWFIPVDFTKHEQTNEDAFAGVYNNVKFKLDELCKS